MFDNLRAWREHADPLYRALPKKVRELHEDVCNNYKDLEEVNGNFCFPNDSLRDRLEAVDNLARVANTVHMWEHYGDTELTSEWRFSNLADQIIRERLGLSDDDESLFISVGVINLYNVGEICLATPESLRACRDYVKEHGPNIHRHRDLVAGIKNLYPEEHKYGILNIERYMDDRRIG